MWTLRTQTCNCHKLMLSKHFGCAGHTRRGGICGPSLSTRRAVGAVLSPRLGHVPCRLQERLFHVRRMAAQYFKFGASGPTGQWL